jgi:uncharacterized protein YndB with AHSA1/START domain
VSTTSHSRSIHIDAPVEKVFDYVKDPRHYYDAYWQEQKPGVTEVQLAPEAGVGSTWSWIGHWLFVYLHGTSTREEYVANERIVDRSSTGGSFTFTFEPDEAGTTLTLEIAVSMPVPLADKVIDALAWQRDRDLDTMLGNLKTAIET